MIHCQNDKTNADLDSRDDVDRLHVLRKERRRGLARTEDCVDSSIGEHEDEPRKTYYCSQKQH